MAMSKKKKTQLILFAQKGVGHCCQELTEGRRKGREIERKRSKTTSQVNTLKESEQNKTKVRKSVQLYFVTAFFFKFFCAFGFVLSDFDFDGNTFTGK